MLVTMLQLQYVLSWSNSRSNRPITTRVPSSSYRLGLMLQQKLMFLQPPWQQQQSQQLKLSHSRVHDDKFSMVHHMTTASSSDNNDSISEEDNDSSNGEEETIIEMANALTSEPSFGTTKKQQQQEVVASSKTKENYLQLAREAYTKLGFNESNNNDNDVSLSEGEYLKKAEEAWMVANINAVSESDSAPFSSLPVTKTLATTIPNTTVPKSSNTLSMNKGMIGGIGVDKSKLMGAGARESFFTSQSKSMGSFFATTKSNTVPVNKGSESVSGKGIGLNKSIPLSEKNKEKLPNTTTVMPFGKSSSSSDTQKMKVGGGFKLANCQR